MKILFKNLKNILNFEKILVKPVMVYSFTFLLTLFLLAYITKFHKTNLSVPFSYIGDSLYTLALIKSFINGEWGLYDVPHSVYLGTPFGFNLGDFPDFVGSNLSFAFIWFISLFTHNVAKINNIFYLLGFFLIPASFIYALKHYKIPYKISVPLGILYAFLPYHFVRMGHVVLAFYFTIPIMTLILTWIWSAKPIFFKKTIDTTYKFDFLSKKALFSSVFLFICGIHSVYYSFFFCFFALVAGVSAYFQRKNKFHLISAVILICIISGSLLLASITEIQYKFKNGENVEGLDRKKYDNEVFGLKPVQFLLPVDEHRVPILAAIKNIYNNSTPLCNENSGSALGIIGSIGFVILLVSMLNINSRKTVYNKYAILLISGILFAGNGGFSTLPTIFVSLLRSYNRISVFIACFAFFALAFALKKYLRNKRFTDVFSILALILMVGLFDQTSLHCSLIGTPVCVPHTLPKYLVDYKTRSANFYSDEEFVERIEKVTPKNGMIFQLPSVPFPGFHEPYAGAGQIGNIFDYDHLKVYLHSEHLKWSYGSFMGRSTAFWSNQTANSPEIVEILRIREFSGIYIDRIGFSDHAKAIEAFLSAKLKQNPIVSNDGRLSYFLISKYN